tara:strand:+ start:52277 stop:53674 length:1398 start_codon:yes stop_codon:yes gene_type:complete
MSKSSDKKEYARMVSRRSLVKWSVAAGAAMGLKPWQVFEALEGSGAGGVAMAAGAACHSTNRSVHIIGGTGGFAWFQLLWPHNDIAAAGNANFAFHAPGEQTIAENTDKLLTLGPEAPWKNLNGSRQVTALMAGRNETHTNSPSTSSTINGGISLFAACAAMQATNPTLVPVIAVDDVGVGNAPGAPNVARVNNGDAIVGLFNSAASRAGSVLENAADAEIYDAHYKALLSLNRMSGRPTSKRSLATGREASALLGKNLADALAPTNADLNRYGINGATPTKLVNLARTLIVTARAFALGLTSSVVLPAMKDDPHGAFTNMTNLRNTVVSLGGILDAFMGDLQMMDDPACSAKLSEGTVITIHGDTPKNPLNRSGWPDGTPGNSNWVYALGAGHLKTGWHGGIDRNGTVTSFDPATGEAANVSSDSTREAASAAIAYAVAKGDMRRVQDFYDGGDISGIVTPITL